MKIQGLIAAPHTPFQTDGDLWLDQVALQAEHLIRTGVSGVFVGGSTGEAPSLTTLERCQLITRWCEVAQGTPLQVIAHVGHNSQRDAMEIAAHAAAQHVKAVAAFSPSYFLPGSIAELVGFLRPIADAADSTPFYYYDIPSMTRVQLPTIELLKVAKTQLPTLAGLKATTIDLVGLQECLAFDNGRFNILYGMDECLLSVLPFGITGAVGSTYNLAAPLYLEIIDAFQQNNMPRARQLQLKSVQFIRCLTQFGMMPGVKFAMSLLGVDCGNCRPPFLPLTDAQKQTLQRELETLGFFEWQTAKQTA